MTGAIYQVRRSVWVGTTPAPVGSICESTELYAERSQLNRPVAARPLPWKTFTPSGVDA